MRLLKIAPERDRRSKADLFRGSLELGGEPLLGLFERFGDFSFLVVEAELVEGGLQVGVDPVQAFVFGGDAREVLLGVFLTSTPI